MYAKATWERVIKQIKISIIMLRPCSRALTELGVLETSFVGGTIYTLSGTGNGNVCRLVVWVMSLGDFGCMRIVFGKWGWGSPWHGGSGGLFMVEVSWCHF